MLLKKSFAPKLDVGAKTTIPPSLRRVQTSAAQGKSVVVVGGGWAGFGAAKHLVENGYDVSLLDAQANPGQCLAYTYIETHIACLHETLTKCVCK